MRRREKFYKVLALDTGGKRRYFLRQKKRRRNFPKALDKLYITVYSVYTQLTARYTLWK